VTLLMDIIPQALPRVREGQLVALGAGSSQRLPELPEVPTISEAGVPGYSAGSWYGFVGPAGIPKDVLAVLNKAINDALRDPAIEKQLKDAGLQVVASTPEAFQKFIEEQVAVSAQIIKDAGITPE